MNTAFVHFCKGGINLGDMVCCAGDMISDFGSTRIDLQSQIEEMVGYNLIFGGGGIFHSGSKAKIEWMARLTRSCNPNTKLIVWGAGINDHDRTDFVYPDFLRDFSLVGMREFGNPYEYVPCPSCLHPAFISFNNSAGGNLGAPVHPVIVFEHHAKPIPLTQFPKLNNAKRKDEFRGVLQFLASGETVISNSYHGAYWSLLLGKKVVIWKPFSNRFLGFKPRVGFCDEDNWPQRVAEAEPAAPNYLSECIEINFRFANKVMDCIKGVAPKAEIPPFEDNPIPDLSSEAKASLSDEDLK